MAARNYGSAVAFYRLSALERNAFYNNNMFFTSGYADAYAFNKIWREASFTGTGTMVDKDGSPIASTISASRTSFSRGGFTGTGRDDEIAGVVHKNEYVLTSSETKELRGGGFPGTLLNDTARPPAGGILLDNITRPPAGGILLNDTARPPAWGELLDNLIRPSSNNSSDFIPTLIDNTVAQLAVLIELVNLGKKNNTKLTQLLGVTVGGTA